MLYNDEPDFNSPIIEKNISDLKNWRIGWAIRKMNYWQRLWFGLTGQSKYVTWDFWERKDNEQN